MNSNLFGIVFFVLFALSLLGLWLWARWRQRQAEKLWPTTWVHEGQPPPGISTALNVIERNTPGMPKAGTIIWVTEPFSVGWTMAAGTVDSYRPIIIRVLYDEKVERTALAHELGHCWSELTKQGFGESPADRRFVAWFTSVNTQIAKELGR